LSEDGLVRVFERNGVTVDVFHVDHGHIEPAYGYRIEYNGRSAVFSGDTIATPLMVNAAKDVDVLFHEAMNTRMMENAAKAFEELDRPGDARRVRGVINYHSDTLEVAKIATEAKVKKLVLTHLDPGPPNAVAKILFVQGMDEYYEGPIVIAEDGMHFSW
jgi:ribonuclease Z